MPFEDIMMKIANNKALTQSEKEELRFISKGIEETNNIVKQWMVAGTVNIPELRVGRLHVGEEVITGISASFLDYLHDIDTNNLTFADFTEDYNNGYLLQNGNTEIVIPTTGVYSVAFVVLWEPHATGYRHSYIVVNGSWVTKDANISSGGTYESVNHIYYEDNFNFGDVVQLQLWQNSGSTLYTISKVFIKKIR